MNNIEAKTGIVWFDRYAYPTYWGFCPDEVSWKKQMKLVGCKNEPYPDFEKDVDARVTEFLTHENKHVVIITLGEFKGRDPIGIVYLIAHEIEHVWQMMKKHMGEENPGNETEAYVKQDMIASVLCAYEKYRHKLFRKIKYQ